MSRQEVTQACAAWGCRRLGIGYQSDRPKILISRHYRRRNAGVFGTNRETKRHVLNFATDVGITRGCQEQRSDSKL
jgi:hypothetical protein